MIPHTRRSMTMSHRSSSAPPDETIDYYVRMTRTFTIAAMTLSATLLTGCSTQISPGPGAPTSNALNTSPVTITGQPSPETLRSLEGTGTLVINSRTQSEIDRLDFDQSGILEAANVSYAWVPMGGDAGYTHAQLEAFARAFESHDGPVLMHCASGGRSRTLYAAYLIRYRNFTPDRALDVVRAMGQGPSGLEMLLGERLSIQRTGEPLPE